MKIALALCLLTAGRAVADIKWHRVPAKEASPPAVGSTSDPGVDEDYGYPDTVGALIIEFPFNYTNGPTVWPNADTDGYGAFGLTFVAPSGYRHDADCPAIPDDSPLKPFEGKTVNPFSMFNAQDPVALCALSCNKTAVALTGEDPCAAGGITDPSDNPMGCYDIGSMAPPDMGVCGYNCTALHGDIDTPTPCTQEDHDNGNWDDCYIYCDTRAFPGTAAAAATIKASPKEHTADKLPAQWHRVPAKEASPPAVGSTSDPGVDEDYGYPETVGGLIIEGPFNYTNGPTVWPDGDGYGAYGLITVAPGGYRHDADCPAIPDDSPLKPLEGNTLNPFSLFSVQTPIDMCLLSCNKTAVALTGEDPCAAGGITDPSDNPMSCYDIGSMAPRDMGVCGYNCTAFHGDIDTPTPCTKEDADNGNWDDCMVYCDTRSFPGTTQPAATIKAPPVAAAAGEA